MNEDQDIFFMHFKEQTPTPRPKPAINLNSNSNDNKEQHQEIQSSQEKDKERDKEDEKDDCIQLFPNEYVTQKFDFTIENFVPRVNLIYFFIAEITKPTMSIIKRKYSKLFGVKNAVDIQRFRYYPNTTNIYTFYGFSN